MTRPPFETTSVMRGLRVAATGDGAESPRLRPVAGPGCCELPPRRQRLVDLDPHFHCSVIGTCLGTAVLRKLVLRHTDLEDGRSSDLQIHHAAVTLAIEGGTGAKALHKLLDEQHAVALRRFAAVKDEDGLSALWREALASGEIPGAYWALMTHPLAGTALRKLAFGDVHMLSHLVGAANRADIRRLVALEQRNAELQEQLAQQAVRQQEQLVDRDRQIDALQSQASRLGAALDELQAMPRVDAGELAALRQALQDREQQVAVQAQRREAAERTAIGIQLALDDAQGRLDRALAITRDLHQEQQALAAELSRPTGADSDAVASPLRRSLSGQRLLYVGGRPGANQAIRQLIEQAGGQWLHHDGGIEDRKGLLAAMLPQAHRVVFPVDCIAHDAMHQLKQLCIRHRIPYHPLRSSGLGSFVAALAASDEAAPLVNGASLASGLCLRHG